MENTKKLACLIFVHKTEIKALLDLHYQAIYWYKEILKDYGSLTSEHKKYISEKIETINKDIEKAKEGVILIGIKIANLYNDLEK